MTVKFTEHEIEMLNFYRTLPEAHQLYIWETMKVILANIQDKMKSLVRQVLLSMAYSGQKQQHII